MCLAIKVLVRNVLFSNFASCGLTCRTADCIKKLSCLVRDIIFRYIICNYRISLNLFTDTLTLLNSLILIRVKNILPLLKI